MMSLDDRLHDLFESSGPDVDELRGDLRQVRARVRQRSLRRRAAFGAVAAAVVAGGAFLLLDGDIGDDVRTDAPPATEPESTTTASPTTETTGSAGAPGTTATSTSSTSTSSTTTSSTTSTTAPPGPSMRNIDLGEATHPNACPGYDDSRSAALRGGVASLPVSDGVTHEVRLEAVGYGDADGDGDEDAVIMLKCIFLGADSDNSGLVRAYRATAGGGFEQIGNQHLFEYPEEPNGATSSSGLSVTLDLDLYDADDGLCCPSTGARQTWRFDGTNFVLTNSTPISPPGAG